MNFCNNYLNHNLIFLLKYDSYCMFYKCTNCNIILNYIINPVNETNWESVFLIQEIIWQVEDYQEDLLTCEEMQIKKLLE